MKMTLEEITPIADDTLEITFDLQGQRLPFVAGQYCRVGVPALDHPDKKDSRKFSILNAPVERDRLTIAFRTGVSGYKRTLQAMEPGATALVSKAKGDLVLPRKAKRPQVYIAGGIGVVPFVSMLRQARHERRLDDVTLLYLNRSRTSAAYLDELEELDAQERGFHLVSVLTRDPGAPRLSPELIAGVVPKPRKSDFYVVGTKSMVKASMKSLERLKVPSKQIVDEDFSGYAYRAPR